VDSVGEGAVDAAVDRPLVVDVRLGDGVGAGVAPGFADIKIASWSTSPMLKPLAPVTASAWPKGVESRSRPKKVTLPLLRTAIAKVS
jgi:hypothetical protein